MYKVKLKPCISRHEYLPDSTFDITYKKEISDIYKSLLSGKWVNVDSIYNQVFKIGNNHYYLTISDFIIKEIK